jgi:hypothetical protein
VGYPVFRVPAAENVMSFPDVGDIKACKEMQTPKSCGDEAIEVVVREVKYTNYCEPCECIWNCSCKIVMPQVKDLKVSYFPS